MKIRNRFTGEINIVKVDEDYFKIYKDDGEFVCPVTLKELNVGWEDAPEEPKKHYSITQFGDVIDEVDGYTSETIDEMKQIGNYFETKEDAEKAVKKLKAWKRLKNKGFGFLGVKGLDYAIDFEVNPPYTHITFDEYTATEEQKEFYNDLTLLFGGEE